MQIRAYSVRPKFRFCSGFHYIPAKWPLSMPDIEYNSFGLCPETVNFAIFLLVTKYLLILYNACVKRSSLLIINWPRLKVECVGINVALKFVKEYFSSVKISGQKAWMARRLHIAFAVAYTQYTIQPFSLFGALKLHVPYSDSLGALRLARTTNKSPMLSWFAGSITWPFRIIVSAILTNFFEIFFQLKVCFELKATTEVGR